MANTINPTYLSQYKNLSAVDKRSTSKNSSTATDAAKNFAGADSSVEISSAGLDALAKLKSDTVDEQSGGGIGDESKLSDKAKGFLENLRKKYGDYDFVISNDLDAAQTVGGTKEYSVMLTVDEIEKMADDEEYAEKVMGQVKDATNTLKDLSEKDLGEGVQFSQLSISFDDQGNQKLFASIEKMSADQKERLEVAREKRAEEKKNAEAQAQDKSLDEPDEELFSIMFKSADVEADNAEDLLSKILSIKWDEIDEEEAFI
ncbi:MAG: hypothetical protein IKN27_14320 [Selenomonadaceae bacterium]|nr:hypothetical protein [Selenomonadaceae bacterium]